jgi:hypothetical protein
MGSSGASVTSSEVIIILLLAHDLFLKNVSCSLMFCFP